MTRSRRRRYVIRPLLILFAALILAAPAQAATYPKQVPKHWHAQKWWLKQAVCIHEREGAWNAATGNGYEGGMQFLRSTWESVGGPVHRSGHWASVASVREQLYRSWLLYLRSGRSFSQWGTAGTCGLR